MNIRNLVVVTLLTMTTGASAQPAKGVIAITNAKVYQSSKAPISNATVIIRNGKIAAVGTKVRIPSGAKVFPGDGAVVTAGLIDASTTLGLVEVSMVSEANDGFFSSEADDKVHAAFRVVDGYNARSVAIPIAHSGGVTSVVASPRGSLISGQAALMRLTGKSTAGATVRTPIAMVATLGSRVMGGSPSRGVVIERLREVLDDARQYKSMRGAYQRNQARQFSAERLDLEALQPVLAGRMPLVIRAHRASDLLAAARMAGELKIKVIIEGGTEAWVVADALAEAKIPVVLDPLENLPYNFDRIRARNDNATRLAKAGVKVAISTLGSASNVRRLRQLAGNAVANGMPWHQALDSITRVPAELYGAKKLGRIDVGAPADLVVWSGDPLELSTSPLAVIIAGEMMPMTSRQTLLRDRYRQIPSK